jgi:hypothetical protein
MEFGKFHKIRFVTIMLLSSAKSTGFVELAMVFGR